VQLGQNTLQQLELARRAPDVLRRFAPRLIVLLLVEVQVWVVADLAQLHLHIVEPADFQLARGTHRAQALALDLPVHELLHGGELALEHVLSLAGKLRLDFTLHPAQQERAYHLM